MIFDKVCSCGNVHNKSESEILVGSGVINKLPNILSDRNIKKPFIIADINTYRAAGEKVKSTLGFAGTEVSEYVLTNTHLEPDEWAVGSAFMHFDTSCDAVVAVGSGVINDIGKILANITKLPYMIVATAPSMDGYASKTSSMSMDGLKVSLPSKCADVIIGDIDILKTAPDKMLKAGLGDMLAKYISICEWRIAHEITGEYYCEEIAQLVRDSLKKCVENASGLLKRDEEAIKAVFEGLIICGEAMAYAGVSRPASGVEHYLSHIWDMRGLEFGTPVDLHGIQCEIGTYIVARMYEKVKKITPDREKALKYALEFDLDKWNEELREFLGKGSLAMIELEKKEKKYDVKKHAERLETIIERWNKIIEIINEEVPTLSELDKLYNLIGLAKSPEDFGIKDELIPMTFKASKDIRDKYVLSRLLWDLGAIDDTDLI